MEVMQKVSDKPPARHAKCGGKLEKEWSRTGFQFKGSGWYVTDYAGTTSDPKESKETKETKADTSSSSPESKESKESKADASSSSSESKSDSTAKTTTEPKTEKKTAGATPAGD
jgi:predicted nucleic acid-binding Zn ribbon protein